MRGIFTVALAAALVACSPGNVCNSDTCSGCCDPAGICRFASVDACGITGQACATCLTGQQCIAGACQNVSSAGGGAGGGSAVGGGSAAGGIGGGSSGGGSATGGGGSATGGGGTATGGGGTATGGGGTGGGTACTGTVCGTACVDTTRDPQHCGSCTRVCGANQTCINSNCVSATCQSGTSCTLGDAGSGVCCSGACTELSTDPNNCGTCGSRCPGGGSCSAATCSTHCSDGGATCPAGTACASIPFFTQRDSCFPTQCTIGNAGYCSNGGPIANVCCGANCVDREFDNRYCGSCFTSCQSNEFCAFGSCQPRVDCATSNADVLCRPLDGGYGTCCHGQCSTIDASNDRDNCGGCGIHCPVGDVCVNQGCRKMDGGATTGCYNQPNACPPGLTCGLGNSRCLTASCSGPTQGEPCSGAGSQNICCANSCADTYFDRNNCGQCGRICAAGTHCEYGTCRPTPTCGPTNSGVNCPPPDGGLGTCCNSTCTKVPGDALNCGGCNIKCPTGQVCGAGQCRLPDAGLQLCTGVPGSCPPGTICDYYRCLTPSCAPGASGETCAFGVAYSNSQSPNVAGKCCSGACVDPTQDPSNCSMCGTACTLAPQLCLPQGFFGSGMSACLKPAGGSCGVTCPPGQFCMSGQCTQSSCGNFPGGFCLAMNGNTGLCCSQGFGAMCVDPAGDSNNCGGCGISCRGGTCTNGVCSTAVAPCTKGHLGQYCNLDAGAQFACCPGGGCVDMTNSQTHCGRCGNTCAAGLTCVNGGCIALTCTTATQNQTCARDAGTGTGTCCSSACVTRSTDPLNCGSCGRICAANETCAGSTCGIDVCDATAIGSVCHRDSGFGIGAGLCCTAGCVDSRTDRLNCGACNRQCPGDAGCVSGNCM